MLQFYWPKICHDPKRLPTEKGKNQNGGTLSFLGKTVFLAKMILKVLTLRLFWGLRSLNFKTFKTLVLDQVLKVLTLRLPSCLLPLTGKKSGDHGTEPRGKTYVPVSY